MKAIVADAGVLIESNNPGLICRVRPSLQRMRASGYWLSDRIVGEIIHQAGE
jgi:predicted nucleic acid-binding protein